MKILVTILFLTCLNSCAQNRKEFINRVTDKTTRNSYFISLNVTNEGKSFPVVVKNEDLCFYFHQKYKYDEEECKKYIRLTLIQNKSLNISFDSIRKFNFSIIQVDNGILSEFRKGESSFLSQYFKNKVLREGINLKEQEYIIYLLFKLEIPCIIDDETGYLIIED